MKRALYTSILITLALSGMRCGTTPDRVELSYRKASPHSPSENSCSPSKELKGSKELQSTFAALLGQNSAEAASFLETNHNRFAILDDLALAQQNPASTRVYLKILRNLAVQAAASCSEGGSELKASCRCGDRAEAQALLARAVPSDRCGLAPLLAEELAVACQKDYRLAVSSLFSSLALARRSSN